MHTKYVPISVLTVITYMMDKCHSVSCMSVLTRTWYLCPQLIKDPIYLCQQIQYTVFIKIAISYSSRNTLKQFETLIFYRGFLYTLDNLLHPLDCNQRYSIPLNDSLWPQMMLHHFCNLHKQFSVRRKVW